MAALWFDEEDIKLDKEQRAVERELDEIQRAYKNEREYINNALRTYSLNNENMHNRIGELLMNERSWLRVGPVLGATVLALTVWELYKGVRGLLRWFANRLTESKYISKTIQNKRIHARNWL